MNYDAKNLPYSLFERIGMSKKDVLGLPKDDLVALLSGRTTSLKEITIKDETGEIKEKAKLSVYSLPDNSLAIKVHPIRAEIKNEFGFKPEQLESLKAGGLIVATKTSQNGEKEPHIFQLDREINEIKSIRVNSVNIPNQIGNILISPRQKVELLEGKPVDLVSKDGEVKTVAVDLLNNKGYSVLNENPNKLTNELTSDKLEQSGKLKSFLQREVGPESQSNGSSLTRQEKEGIKKPANSEASENNVPSTGYKR